jgi:dihydroxyacetone kinase-like predicted kinase
MVSESTYAIKRQRIAFLILFYTGMQVGSLKEIKVESVTQALNKSVANSSHPNMEQDLDTALLEKALLIICDDSINFKSIKVLLQNKVAKNPLSTTEKKVTKSIHWTTLTKELNCRLGQLKVEPKLTTYAFRKAFAIQELENPPLYSVQLALNHKSSLTTARYSRQVRYNCKK